MKVISCSEIGDSGLNLYDREVDGVPREYSNRFELISGEAERPTRKRKRKPKPEMEIPEPEPLSLEDFGITISRED